MIWCAVSGSISSSGIRQRGIAFSARRAKLTELLATAKAPVFVTPATNDIDIARHWLAAHPFGGRS